MNQIMSFVTPVSRIMQLASLLENSHFDASSMSNNNNGRSSSSNNEIRISTSSNNKNIRVDNNNNSHHDSEDTNCGSRASTEFERDQYNVKNARVKSSVIEPEGLENC